MKTGNTRWMIWIIVILGLMNMATIITVFYNRNKSSVTLMDEIQVPSVSESSSVRFSGRYFRDELGLTREQMNDFSVFNPRFRQEARRINILLSELRQAMLSEMSSIENDTSRLNVLSDSIGMLHSELKKATYRYYLDFKEICNPDQHDKLEHMFGEMFDGDLPSGPMGRRRQGGGRMRWNREN